MADVKVTIVGLGRIGSSFGLAIKALNQKSDTKHRFSVVGYDKSTTTMRAATKVGAIDREVSVLDTAVSDADLIFLATPYNVVRDVLEIIGPELKPGAVVVDTSPLKQPSVEWASKFFRKAKNGQVEAYLVGITPVLNPEYLGNVADDPESAKADMFREGIVIVSPAANCPAEAVQLVTDLADLLRLKVHFIDPAEHDGMAAAMDNLPIVLQLGYFQSLMRSSGWSDTQFMGNPAFFLATYRLMEEDPEALSAPIFQNRQNTLLKLDKVIESLQGLRETLRSEDPGLLAEYFDSAMRNYAEWRLARLKNKFADEPELTEVKSNFGFGMFPSLGGKSDKSDKKKKK